MRPDTVTYSVRIVSGKRHEADIGTEEEQSLHATHDSALPAKFVIGCHYAGHCDAGIRTLITVRDG